MLICEIKSLLDDKTVQWNVVSKQDIYMVQKYYLIVYLLIIRGEIPLYNREN